MVKGEIYTVKLLSRPISFQSTVIKLYLRPELTKEPTFHNAIEHVEPARINKSVPLL
jgi:hypothetical protein